MSTRRPAPHLLLAGVLLFAGPGASGGQEKKEKPRPDAAKEFDEKVKPLVAKFCVSCHGPEKKKGELDLTKVKSYDDVLANLELWQRAVERVNAFEMPPAKAAQPSFEEKGLLSKWYGGLPKGKKLDCEQLATDRTQRFYKGYAMSRRLNRSEFENSVRDLFGADVKVAKDLPADGSGGEGFDNNGDALFTSPLLLEKYMDAAERVLLTVLPDKGPARNAELEAARHAQTRDSAKAAVGSFARRAFRRPVAPEEVERPMTMFDRARNRGDSFEASLRLALKAVLLSPNFLFLIEPEPKEEGVYALGPYQTAQRLSYFLWSSIPDEELLRLAAEGKLQDNEVLRGQVRRMLKDPRSKALGEDFALQWLEIEPLGKTVRPDPKKFPEFDDELAEAMKSEAALFFHDVISRDRSLIALIDSDTTFVNARLAKLYGIAGVEGREMRKVTLADKNRGGVVGMAGVLAVSSYPLRTSPVVRGKWILESLLGSKVPPPPPDAGTLPDPAPEAKPVSLRQRLEVHRTKPECASCHARMDPLGFSLETFDPLGRWRTSIDGLPVDAVGKLPTGESVEGPVQLKKILTTRKDEVMTQLSRKMLGYALGRGLNKFDTCVVEDAVKALKANDYKASAMIETIALSYPFRHRYAKK